MRRKTGLPKAGRDLMAELLGMDTREAKPRILTWRASDAKPKASGFQNVRRVQRDEPNQQGKDE